jgi:hypothetical protein
MHRIIKNKNKKTGAKMNTSTYPQLHTSKITVDKDVNAKVKSLQRQLVYLTFSGQRNSDEFNSIVNELNTIRTDADKFYNSID